MPFEENNASDRRLQFIGEWVRGDVDITKLCRKYGISRPTGYKWIERYQQEGLGGLVDRPHGSKSHPNVLDSEIEKLLLQARGRHPSWGPKKLVEWIREKEGLKHVCALSTASKILRLHGLSHPQKRHRRTTPWPDPLGGFEEINAIWCMDFKGWFRLGNGARCDPFTITDGFSRYLLRCQASDKMDFEGTKRILEAAFREYGMPK